MLDSSQLGQHQILGPNPPNDMNGKMFKKINIEIVISL